MELCNSLVLGKLKPSSSYFGLSVFLLSGIAICGTCCVLPLGLGTCHCGRKIVWSCESHAWSHTHSLDPTVGYTQATSDSRAMNFPIALPCQHQLREHCGRTSIHKDSEMWPQRDRHVLWPRGL